MKRLRSNRKVVLKLPNSAVSTNSSDRAEKIDPPTMQRDSSNAQSDIPFAGDDSSDSDLTELSEADIDALVSLTLTQDKGCAPASSIDKQLTTPPRSSPMPHQSITSNKELPPLLSPSLPPIAGGLFTVNTKDQLTTNTKPPPSLKMVILPKPELETLKSHNSILRSHNLSLARQNAKLRVDNTTAAQLIQELNDDGPVDHNNCISKETHQQLSDEKDELYTQFSAAAEQAELMKQCALEWARRENLWEMEKQLMKNEVVELVAKVRECEGREKTLVERVESGVKREEGLSARVRQLEALARDAQRSGAMERARILRLQEYIRSMHTVAQGQAHMAHMQMQMQMQAQGQEQMVAQGQGQGQDQGQGQVQGQGGHGMLNGGGGGSVYPEL